MTKPVFDFILGVKTLWEFGIVLDFQTKEIAIDESILSMRDINNQFTSSQIKKALSVDHNMVHELQSTEEATQCAINILDAKYEKADLQSVVHTNCPHLSLPDQNKLLDFPTKYEDLFDCALGDWNIEPVSFDLKEDANP